MLKDKRRTLLKVGLGLLLCIFLIPGGNVFAESQTVKVGYAQIPGFFEQNANGSYEGIAYELLSEVSIYTGWKCRFVPVKYEDVSTELENGEIDLFIPLQKEEGQALAVAYSKEPFYKDRASLIALPDADVYYNDFEQFDHLVIGSVKESQNADRFREYLESQGCEAEIRENYHSLDALDLALKEGEIDAFISDSECGIPNRKIICSLEPSLAYVVAPEGERKLLDQFDKAIKKITQDTPLFQNNLEEKYRVPDEGTCPSLTREEADYIAEKSNVTVMVGPQDMNTETGEFSGSIGQVLAMISDRTGLSFTGVTAKDSEQIFREFAAGKADVLFSFDSNYAWAQKNNAWLTKEYASFNGVMIRRANVAGTPKNVAVVKGSYIEYYIRNNTGYQVVSCSSYREGIDMVQKGKVDAVVINSPLGNYYSTFPQYSNLTFTTMYDFSNSYCIAVSKSSDAELVGILNKSIQSLSKATLNTYFETQVYSRPTSITDYFYANPRGGVLIIASGVLIILILAFALMFLLILRKQNRDLVKMNREKMDFLSRMSHDIRTPMNGIIGMTQAAQDYECSPEVLDCLGKIESSGNFLLNLVNDFLEISKESSGKMTLHPEPYLREELGQFLESVIRPLCDSKNIKFHIIGHGGAEVVPIVDRLRTNQILMNLLSNAVKYTAAGGDVTLKYDTKKKDDKIRLILTISDTGIGMSQEFQKRMFEPFTQENTLGDSQTLGTGLGLSITKSLVDLMGGTIEVESEKGKGTTFRITLLLDYMNRDEYNKQYGSREQRHTMKTDALSGLRILVCEDHPLNAEIINRLLKKSGAEPEIAENGKIGTDMFRNSEEGYYDVILMDIRMPVMDGISATKLIRKMNRADAAAVPIIAMTANAYENEENNSREAGMNGHLTKPVEPGRLINMILDLI